MNIHEHVLPRNSLEYIQTHLHAKNKGLYEDTLLHVVWRGILKTERYVALLPVTFNSISVTHSHVCIISELHTDVNPDSLLEKLWQVTTHIFIVNFAAMCLVNTC